MRVLMALGLALSWMAHDPEDGVRALLADGAHARAAGEPGLLPPLPANLVGREAILLGGRNVAREALEAHRQMTRYDGSP